jgi:type II secretory pathway pseudopilin PulG
MLKSNVWPGLGATDMRIGASLLELIVTIAILALLASLLMPVFATVRDGIQRTRCASNLRQIHLAGLGFSADNLGWALPRQSRTLGGTWWRPLVEPYVDAESASWKGDVRAQRRGLSVLRDCATWQGYFSDSGALGNTALYQGYDLNWQPLRPTSMAINMDGCFPADDGKPSVGLGYTWRRIRMAEVSSPATRLFAAESDALTQGVNMGAFDRYPSRRMEGAGFFKQRGPRHALAPVAYFDGRVAIIRTPEIERLQTGTCALTDVYGDFIPTVPGISPAMAKRIAQGPLYLGITNPSAIAP